jgi:hypothetical protein
VLAIKDRFLLTIGDPEWSVMLTLCDPVLAIIGSCSQSSRRARIICNRARVPRRFSQTIVFEKVRRIGISAAELTANLFSKLFLISASQKLNL